jgi:hypothetical protein
VASPVGMLAKQAQTAWNKQSQHFNIYSFNKQNLAQSYNKILENDIFFANYLAELIFLYTFASDNQKLLITHS